jgi:nucleoside-diphosphate-sugar epimerase
MTNKVAVVTGGTSGIGRAVAIVLAAAGARVVVRRRTLMTRGLGEAVLSNVFFSNNFLFSGCCPPFIFHGLLEKRRGPPYLPAARLSADLQGVVRVAAFRRRTGFASHSLVWSTV